MKRTSIFHLTPHPTRFCRTDSFHSIASSFRLHNSASVFKALSVAGLAGTVRFKGARYGQAGAVAVVMRAVAVIGQDVAVTTGRSVRYRRGLRIDTGHKWSVG